MARTLTERPLSTRSARSKLSIGLHWKSIDPEVHLGYRKGLRGGRWLVRWRNGAGYRQTPLGVADDEMKEGNLDYNAACRAARRMVEAARKEERAAVDGPAPTVRTAVEIYIAQRDKRDSDRKGRPVRSDAGQRLGRYVLGQEKRGKQPAVSAAPLADTALHALSEADLMRWRDGLPEAMTATTKQRLANDLKAALNASYLKNRRVLDRALPSIIKHGLKAESRDGPVRPARDNQILPDGDVARLLQAAREVDAGQAWEGDLFRLVLVLAATGARFSQVVRMRVADCQIAESRLLVPVSRKGQGKSGTTAVRVGDDVIGALRPVVTGRAAGGWLLERWRHKQVAGGPGGLKYERDGRGPWQEASELQRPWQAIRERAGLPDAIPYALRHTSIVRCIRANLPIRLVAALHDTSVVMIERHYSRYIVDGLEELAARAVVPLVPPERRGRVVQFQGV